MPSSERSGDYYLGDMLLLGDVDGDDDLDMIITTTLATYDGTGSTPTRLLEFR